MAAKTPVTLLEQLRKAFAAEERRRRYRAELARLNRHADELNAEQADALRYQAEPDEIAPE